MRFIDCRIIGVVVVYVEFFFVDVVLEIVKILYLICVIC